MRVGANARQHQKIRKMVAQGVSFDIIQKTLRIEPQSLEHIIAHIENRDERTLASETNPEVLELRRQNAELAAKIAKYEGVSTETESADDTDDPDKGEEEEEDDD